MAFLRFVSMVCANFALIVLAIAGVMFAAAWVLSPIAATAYLLSLTGLDLIASLLLSALITVLASCVVVDYFKKR